MHQASFFNEEFKCCDFCRKNLHLSKFSPTKKDPSKRARVCRDCKDEHVKRTKSGIEANDAKESDTKTSIRRDSSCSDMPVFAVPDIFANNSVLTDAALKAEKETILQEINSLQEKLTINSSKIKDYFELASRSMSENKLIVTKIEYLCSKLKKMSK